MQAKHFQSESAHELLEAFAQGLVFLPELLEAQLPELSVQMLPRAIEAIATLGGKMEKIKKFMLSSDEGVVAATITACSKLQQHYDAENFLTDPRPRVRLAAVRVAANVQILESIATTDTVGYVRVAAKVRLWQLEQKNK